MNTSKIAVAALAAALGLSACAGTPEPKEEIAVARTRIDQARTAGAPSEANYELRQAEEKFSRAERALRDGDNLEAKRLAEAADADARLAIAKTNSRRARAAVAELQDNIRVLREELNRAPALSR